MIVCTLGLEEYRVFGVSPEMRHRIAAVTPTRVNLQTTGALSVRTWFALLLLSRLYKVKTKLR